MAPIDILSDLLMTPDADVFFEAALADYEPPSFTDGSPDVFVPSAPPTLVTANPALQRAQRIWGGAGVHRGAQGNTIPTFNPSLFLPDSKWMEFLDSLSRRGMPEKQVQVLQWAITHFKLETRGLAFSQAGADQFAVLSQLLPHVNSEKKTMPLVSLGRFLNNIHASANELFGQPLDDFFITLSSPFNFDELPEEATARLFLNRPDSLAAGLQRLDDIIGRPDRFLPLTHLEIHSHRRSPVEGLTSRMLDLKNILADQPRIEWLRVEPKPNRVPQKVSPAAIWQPFTDALRLHGFLPEEVHQLLHFLKYRGPKRPPIVSKKLALESHAIATLLPRVHDKNEGEIAAHSLELLLHLMANGHHSPSVVGIDSFRSQLLTHLPGEKFHGDLPHAHLVIGNPDSLAPAVSEMQGKITQIKGATIYVGGRNSLGANTALTRVEDVMGSLENALAGTNIKVIPFTAGTIGTAFPSPLRLLPVY